VEKNLSSGRVNNYAAVVLLLAASVASASPTVISDSTQRPVSISADSAANISACNLDSSAVNDQMAELAGALLRPPSTDNQPIQGGNQYLPAVPPALLMVLTGFLCVSLVRDRRTWVAVLAGLLWVGQTGINALPELTSRLSRKVHNSRLIEPTLLAAYPLGGNYYPESYNEQTRYSGLLHHLEGIPGQTGVFSRIRETVIASEAKQSQTRNNAFSNNYASQYAFISALSLLNSLCDCLVRPTRQFICFTPAFIFNLIPRGPPISALKTLL
jgi:hypothetical protein